MSRTAMQTTPQSLNAERIWSRISGAIARFPMTHIENVSRRGFLKGMAGTSAFVLGVTLAPKSLFAKGSADGEGAAASRRLPRRRYRRNRVRDRAPLRDGQRSAHFPAAHRRRRTRRRLVSREGGAGDRRREVRRSGHRRFPLGGELLRPPPPSRGCRPPHADASRREPVERAGGGMLDGFRLRIAQSVGEESRIRRAGGSGVETGSTEGGDDPTEAAERVEIYRERCGAV